MNITFSQNLLNFSLTMVKRGGPLFWIYVLFVFYIGYEMGAQDSGQAASDAKEESRRRNCECGLKNGPFITLEEREIAREVAFKDIAGRKIRKEAYLERLRLEGKDKVDRKAGKSMYQRQQEEKAAKMKLEEEQAAKENGQVNPAAAAAAVPNADNANNRPKRSADFYDEELEQADKESISKVANKFISVLTSRWSNRLNAVKGLFSQKVDEDEYVAQPSRISLPQGFPLEEEMEEGSSLHSRQKRMVGGYFPLENEYPWVLALATTKNLLSYCGAVLINEEWAMTTVGCALLLNPLGYVIFGQHQLIDDLSGDIWIQDKIKVKKILKHPDYDQVQKHPDYDFLKKRNNIALLQLEKPTRLNRKIAPPCWPSTEPSEGMEVTAVGWGEIYVGSRLSHRIRKADLVINSQTICNSSYSDGVMSDNTMICASPAAPADSSLPLPVVGTCHGDQGGPVFTLTAQGRHELVGIISWGYACGKRPDALVNVKAYEKWWKPIVGQPACQKFD